MKNFWKHMSRIAALSVTLALALLVTEPARAQLAQGTQTYSNGSRLDASSTLCSLAAAVNATQAAGTCTITPPNGQSVYITHIHVANCIDGTASTSSIQQNFTSTNLGGLTIETAFLSAATITSNAGVPLCDVRQLALTTPLKSAQPGVAVTIVPPAQAAHGSFPITVLGYFAP